MSARTDPEDYRDRDLHELHAHEAAMEPVGLEEIAARFGVKRGTVDQWRRRRVLSSGGRWQTFPDPEPTTVGGRPWWRWGRVHKWGRDTGRLDK